MVHLLVLERDGVVVATTYSNLIPNLTRSAAPYAVIENVVVEELPGNSESRFASVTLGIPSAPDAGVCGSDAM